MCTTALQAAMQFGAPEPTQIVMKVRAVPLGDKPEDAVAAGNEPDPKTRGPYQRYAVDYAADARHIQFVPNADGTFKVSLEFAVLVYDDQGKLYNSNTKIAGADNGTAAKKATKLKSGMQFHQEISIPVKGDYYIRACIHDRVNDAMGAVEMDVNVVKAAADKAAAALASSSVNKSIPPKPDNAPAGPGSVQFSRSVRRQIGSKASRPAARATSEPRERVIQLCHAQRSRGLPCTPDGGHGVHVLLPAEEPRPKRSMRRLAEAGDRIYLRHRL
jgi:hypothetical protein